MTQIRSVAKLIVVVLALLSLGGCFSSREVHIHPDGISTTDAVHWHRSELYFGLSRKDGPITPEMFNLFVDEEITPRFKDGLTVIPAHGQWLSGTTGQVTKEETRIVLIYHHDSTGAVNKLKAIATSYKERFDQESVLIATSHTDVTFE